MCVLIFQLLEQVESCSFFLSCKEKCWSWTRPSLFSCLLSFYSSFSVSLVLCFLLFYIPSFLFSLAFFLSAPKKEVFKKCSTCGQMVSSTKQALHRHEIQLLVPPPSDALTARGARRIVVPLPETIRSLFSIHHWICSGFVSPLMRSTISRF